LDRPSAATEIEHAVKKLLPIHNVSHQRELLLAFAGQMQSIDVIRPEKDLEKYVENFIANNCG
jgi:hypothetical protein